MTMAVSTSACGSGLAASAGRLLSPARITAGVLVTMRPAKKITRLIAAESMVTPSSTRTMPRQDEVEAAAGEHGNAQCEEQVHVRVLVEAQDQGKDAAEHHQVHADIEQQRGAQVEIARTSHWWVRKEPSSHSPAGR